ncbi:related to General amino acid permease AGP2 [Saccharomycodes ludwigii]|uniref:Related to General amino acid permease AGP2 n=1 Tax=Saccharomycodes ludwigii TaxID=36035 RepID=A0A376B7B6_9ASCO|nr:related to General amino acid permease AGP2 [Saccharomycodes ludwigii]
MLPGEIKQNNINTETIATESINCISTRTNSISINTTDSFDEYETPIEYNVQRKLVNRYVQLISISGIIGTALFVSIGKALYHGGSGSLLLGFAIWCLPILAITVSTAEMVCYLPINSPFLRMAQRCCDKSLGRMAAWNFWFLQCVQIPFEIVAVNTIIHYWRTDYSPAIPLCVQVALYLLISIFAVRYYGEIEFWLALWKIILAVGLFFFTLITMCGGNPLRDAYGFRNFKKNSFKKYYPTGIAPTDPNHGEGVYIFQGLLACIIQGSFTIAGPEYVSMIAGETKTPRKILPIAFKQVFIRLTVLFLGGCLCIGIVCNSTDPSLTAAINESRPGAGSSPYVIAMNNLKIKVLPDIVNAALITAAFSAGNAYTYCSSRSLYGMALDGYVPKIFTKCNRYGVPIYCVLVSLCWGALSFLQLGENSAIVLNWIINFITASQLINFFILCIIYLKFRASYNYQKFKMGVKLPDLPFKSWGQPYTALFGCVCTFVMIFLQGYSVFFKENWNIRDFLFCYIMVFIDIGIYLFYKLFYFKMGRNDKFVPLDKVDLITGLKEIELHELDHGFDRFRFFYNGEITNGSNSIIMEQDPSIIADNKKKVLERFNIEEVERLDSCDNNSISNRT